MLEAKVMPKQNNTFTICVMLDLSTFNKTQDFNGYVIAETNSKTLPNSIVQVKAQYISPVEIYPDSIVIGSDLFGDVTEKVLVKSSTNSKISNISCGNSGLTKVKFVRSESREHLIQLIVSESQEVDLDEKIRIDVEFFTDDKEIVSRSLFLPVYRFSKGEKL